MDPWTQEWNQERAEQRSIESMHRIALDAMEIEEDHVLGSFAAARNLTVNEVVYYLNAYESGGEAGLWAIGNPDIIPPDLARDTIKTIGGLLDAQFEGRLPYRLTDEGTAIGVYEIQQRMNGEKYLFAICQLRLTLEKRMWHLYWMRKFGAWWPYSPPASGHKYTLKARLQQLLEDEDGCFWG